MSKYRGDTMAKGAPNNIPYFARKEDPFVCEIVVT